MTTPTPGDLSARLPELPEAGYVDEQETDGGALVREDFYTADQMRAYAIAALSALPAAGGAWRPIASVPRDGTRVVVWMPDGTFSSASYSAHSEPQGVYWMIPTTPQPSAAEDYESWAKQERQREDTATRLGSAAIGAQGDGELAWQNIENAEAEFLRNLANKGDLQPLVGGMLRHCARLLDKPAPPAAGKGVAEYVLALLVTGRYVTQAKVDEARRIALGCEPAQPADDDEAMVPGDADDMAEALAEISTTLGCDNTLDEILHAIHAIPRKEAADGVVLALKEPTDAMNDAGGRSLNSDLGFPSYRADRAASAARNAYVTMLAAGPVAAALTRQPVAGDGWLPIESAPKTDALILGFHEDWWKPDFFEYCDRRNAWVRWGNTVPARTPPTMWLPLRLPNAAPAATPTGGEAGG